MKEVTIWFVVLFVSIGVVFTWLGNGENRHIGFENGQCPKGNYICGVTWRE